MPDARPDAVPGDAVRGRDLLLAIDTATRTAVVAIGERDGGMVAEERWSSEHRHGAELLQHLDVLFARAGITLDDVAAIVAGIGPGSFTGLRVGLATAKVIAYSARIPVVAVSSLEAIAYGALASGASDAAGTDPSSTGDGGAPRVVVTLPAGTTDRYLATVKRDAGGLPAIVRAPRLVAGVAPSRSSASVASALADDPDAPPLVAIDLEGEAPAAASAAGRAALEQLAQGLLTIGAARLRAGATVDIAELVPAYVALPRGVTDAASGMAWSPDLR